MKHRLTTVAALVLLAACGEAPTEPTVNPVAPSFSLTTDPFTTVGTSSFTVPAGVTSLTVVAVGGGGGGSLFSTLFAPPNTGAPGGAGAMVTATLSVTPGQVLDLVIGAGGPGANWSAGGGHSTTVSSGGVPLVIAGGGGGAGEYAPGGSGGGLDGAGGNGGGATNTGKYHNRSGTGGMGGSGGVGGSGGTGNYGAAGQPGGNGNALGGAGGWYGGSGGDGYGGGGGGGTVSGGGAGGSFGPANTVFAPANNAGPVGANGGDGFIEISYETMPVVTSADQCKKGGWLGVTDDLGNHFKNQGDCVSYVATKGKNKGAGGS